MSRKKISVVVCTYNGGRFLREQLDSVIKQTYPLHEIIIQDDGSTDNTLMIAEEYASKWPLISVYKNESEHGINGNFFSAMQRTTGDFIAICDQDDIWMPDKISRQVNAIGDKLLCGGRSKPFSEDGSFVFYDKRLPNITLFRMLYCAEIAGHTMLIKRELLDLLPECKVMNIRCYDIILSVFTAAHESIVYVDDILVKNRRYSAANTYTSIETSIPTIGNAWNMLLWCLRHYREVKQRSGYIYNAWEEMLTLCGSNKRVCKEGIYMMQLQQSKSLVDLIKLMFFCLRHSGEICHTKGTFPMRYIRAILFPLTSCFYQRKLITSQKE